MPRTITKRKDSRIGKTDRDIKRALLALISKKKYSQIKIDEILQEAPVTKVTFYKHFASKDDVLDSIRKDVLFEMDNALKENTYNNIMGGGVGFL